MQGSKGKLKVSFRIESRPLTPAQAEAGKKLFKRLIARAQTQIKQASSEDSSS